MKSILIALFVFGPSIASANDDVVSSKVSPTGFQVTIQYDKSARACGPFECNNTDWLQQAGCSDESGMLVARVLLQSKHRKLIPNRVEYTNYITTKKFKLKFDDLCEGDMPEAVFVNGFQVL